LTLQGVSESLSDSDSDASVLESGYRSVIELCGAGVVAGVMTLGLLWRATATETPLLWQLGVVFAAVLLPDLRYFDRRSRLRLDSEGIRCRAWGWNTLVPWTEVIGFMETGSDRDRAVLVQLRSPRDLVARWPTYLRLYGRWLRGASRSGFRIELGRLAGPPDRVLDFFAAHAREIDPETFRMVLPSPWSQGASAYFEADRVRFPDRCQRCGGPPEVSCTIGGLRVGPILRLPIRVPSCHRCARLRRRQGAVPHLAAGCALLVCLVSFESAAAAPALLGTRVWQLAQIASVLFLFAYVFGSFRRLLNAKTWGIHGVVELATNPGYVEIQFADPALAEAVRALSHGSPQNGWNGSAPAL